MKKKQLSMNQIHDFQLDIMDEIVRICKLLDLNYYLAFGTLIGCIRHNGFIPWDDDVDICMFREDYEKLILNFNSIANKRYRLIHYSNTKHYIWNFAKIIDTKTSLQEKGLNPKFPYGLYVDIFPIDGFPASNEAEAEEYHQHLIQYFRRFMIGNFRYSTFVWKIADLCNLFQYKGANRFHYLVADPGENCKEWNDYVVSFSRRGVTDSVVILDISPLGEIPVLRKEAFGAGESHRFEDRFYCIPSGFDEILRAYYGDYMKLPPKNKQVGSHYKYVYYLD